MLLAFIVSLFLAQFCFAEVDKDAQKRLYNFGLGKRAAYTYLSEYKRLPIYNFGLGKRSDFSYYGKQLNDMDMEYDDENVKDDFKRMKQYSFGLGKRLPLKTYNFGLGKRSQYEDSDAYFLDGFDEDKRSTNNGHRFSFGLGKRDGAKQEIPGRRSMQYNFGLGKRSQTKDDANPNFNL